MNITEKTILVPRGFALVPLEPTEEMIAAGMQHSHGYNGSKNVADAYREMVLAAAIEYPQYLNEVPA